MTGAIWPLFDLVASTPKLTLRYVTDELAAELAELATHGIHDPATMPFSEPWTDAEPPELQRNTVRYFWRCRAETTTADWHLNLAAHDRDGALVGVCTLSAAHFPSTRTATTGSWIGRRFQGQGLGREMRHAALHLIFDGLHGGVAATRAWHDNAASLGVTRSLPYTEQEPVVERRRGHPDTMLVFTMGRRQWETLGRSDIRLGGVEPVRDFLGVTTQP
ncbi:GNAT family N-acetyltransferase [Mycobacterium yunnanensis]|uniref:GNAT family N-acetyltransferase n=1 Tax=Mycobacterium yunnanensis TaxID=368477 RepID=A0A9X2Z0W6_9MYCO|nr:GNAT family N-acetyltransferase [Mycobacterium yunnanensis]MCV7420961.1 GNAT family N-acetyltransferase [Mycobacterium yunnanensis]